MSLSLGQKSQSPVPEEAPSTCFISFFQTQVIQKLPWKERFVTARCVSRTWLEAADAVAPLTSFTAWIHKEVNAKPDSVAARRDSSSQASSQGSTSTGTSATPPSSATPPPPPGTASSGGSGEGAESTDRDLCPPRSWLKSGRFRECSREEGMSLLKDALRGLELSTEHEEASAVGAGVVVGEDGIGRKQWRRLGPYLAALEAALCVERGGLFDPTSEAEAAVAAEAAARGALPFGVRLREGVGEARAAARTAASVVDPPSGPSDVIDIDEGDDGDRRWDGWRVFAVTIVFACSEDRPFLCRSFQESVWGASGMPRTQIIELLSRMCWALRPPVEAQQHQHQQQQQPATGFQAASRVSTSGLGWDAGGSYRLRMDLLQCIYLMEAHFVR